MLLLVNTQDSQSHEVANHPGDKHHSAHHRIPIHIDSGGVLA